MDVKKLLKDLFNLVFKEESVEGYIAFFIFAIILFKWIIPFFSKIILKTDMPIYVIVTSSMSHKVDWIDETYYNYFKKLGLNPRDLPFSNGLNKGDVVFVVGKSPKDIKVGDVVIYRPYGSNMVLLHRVVKKVCDETCYFTMKGDANPYPIDMEIYGKKISEVNVTEDRIKGVVIFRIPYIGYPKVILVELFYRIVFGTSPYPL